MTEGGREKVFDSAKSKYERSTTAWYFRLRVCVEHELIHSRAGRGISPITRWPLCPPDIQVTLKNDGLAPAAWSVTWWLNVPKFGWGVARSISDQKWSEHLPPKVMYSESMRLL